MLEIDTKNLQPIDIKLFDKGRFWNFNGVFIDPDLLKSTSSKSISRTIFTDASSKHKIRVTNGVLRLLKMEIEKCHKLNLDSTSCYIPFKQGLEKNMIINVFRNEEDGTKIDNNYSFVVRNVDSNRNYTFHVKDKILCVRPDWNGWKKKRKSQKVRIESKYEKDLLSKLELARLYKNFIEEKYKNDIAEADKKCKELESQYKFFLEKLK